MVYEKPGLVVRNNNAFGEGYRFLHSERQLAKGLGGVLFKNQSGLGETGKVFHWVFGTDDCRREVQTLKSRACKL